MEAHQIICQNCRKLNDHDRKFCIRCGESLQGDIVEPPPLDPSGLQVQIGSGETPIPSLLGNEPTHPLVGRIEEAAKKAPTAKPGLSRRQAIAVLGGSAALVAVTAGAIFGPQIIRNITRSPANGTITVHLSYGSDKDKWLQAAIQSFYDTDPRYQNKSIAIDLDSRSALDVINKVMSGDLHPTLWSPASSITLGQLSDKWKKANNKEIVASGGRYVQQSIVESPTVFAMWESRAQVFLNHYNNKVDWAAIQDAVTKKGSWSDIGGQASWGPVKLGQTRPDLTNAGIIALILIAYSYYKTQRDLTLDQVHDPQFQTYMNSIEQSVTQYGRSTGTYLENVVAPLGPAGFDIIFTEENLLLTDASLISHTAGEPLRIFYPNPIFMLDHPFAILQAPWVKPEEQEAALVFLKYLYSPEAQRQALQFGYRPANLAVTIKDQVPNNPFLGQNVQSDLGSIAQTPDLSVIAQLINIWQTANPNPVTAAG